MTDQSFSGPKEGEPQNWGQVVMPVGKYAGYTIEVIPDYYIKWLAENWRTEEICQAADLELKYRQQYEISVTEDPSGPKSAPAPYRREPSPDPVEGTRATPDDDIPF